MEGPGLAVLGDGRRDPGDVFPRGNRRECERDAAKIQFEQPRAERGFIVIIALAHRACDDLDLCVIRAE